MNQQRYEKEIEEILKQAGDGPAPAPEPQRSPPQRRRPKPESSPSLGRWLAAKLAGTGYKAVLLLGISLLVISWFTDGLYLFLAGVAFLLAGYIMYYRAPRVGRGGGAGLAGGGSSGPKMWRGRSIEPDDPPTRRRR